MKLFPGADILPLLFFSSISIFIAIYVCFPTKADRQTHKSEYTYIRLEQSVKLIRRHTYYYSSLIRKITMAKEQHSNREAKKKPLMSFKEKRAAKKAKKDTRSTFLESEKK